MEPHQAVSCLWQLTSYEPGAAKRWDGCTTGGAWFLPNSSLTLGRDFFTPAPISVSTEHAILYADADGVGLRLMHMSKSLDTCIARPGRGEKEVILNRREQTHFVKDGDIIAFSGRRFPLLVKRIAHPPPPALILLPLLSVGPDWGISASTSASAAAKTLNDVIRARSVTRGIGTPLAPLAVLFLAEAVDTTKAIAVARDINEALNKYKIPVHDVCGLGDDEVAWPSDDDEEDKVNKTRTGGGGGVGSMWGQAAQSKARPPTQPTTTTTTTTDGGCGGALLPLLSSTPLLPLPTPQTPQNPHFFGAVTVGICVNDLLGEARNGARVARSCATLLAFAGGGGGGRLLTAAATTTATTIITGLLSSTTTTTTVTTTATATATTTLISSPIPTLRLFVLRALPTLAMRMSRDVLLRAMAAAHPEINGASIEALRTSAPRLVSGNVSLALGSTLLVPAGRFLPQIGEVDFTHLLHVACPNTVATSSSRGGGGGGGGGSIHDAAPFVTSDLEKSYLEVFFKAEMLANGWHHSGSAIEWQRAVHDHAAEIAAGARSSEGVGGGGGGGGGAVEQIYSSTLDFGGVRGGASASASGASTLALPPPPKPSLPSLSPVSSSSPFSYGGHLTTPSHDHPSWVPWSPRGTTTCPLIPYTLHPESYPGIVLAWDHCHVLVRDRYPKSRVHWLVLPRRGGGAGATGGLPSVKGVGGLDSSHAAALESLCSFARSFMKHAEEAEEAARPNSQEPGAVAAPILMGFHAKPSIPYLHLHIISADLSGPSMKSRKHYNSFRLRHFFIDAHAVLTSISGGGLSEGGKFESCLYSDVKGDNPAALKRPIEACHRCGRGGWEVPVPYSEKGSDWDIFKEHLRVCKG